MRITGGPSMKAKPTTTSDGAIGPDAHVERVVSVVTGQPILIRCECPLGHDHTYAEWQARFGDGTGC
jgi:hypothetical protein